MSDAHELHDLNPTGRFTDRAADYVRFRPDYPAAALDAMLAGLQVDALTVADVGAGTGISARALAARGACVIAVEPNAAMREAAAPHPLVAWREGTAEATGLANASVGLVLCAQAFHWFRPREALHEFRRILAPGGRLALMWNNRDDDDPFTHGYIEAIRAVSGEHPAEMHAFDPAVIELSGAFGPPWLASCPHGQDLDLAGVVGRAVSASYVPREGARREALVRALGELFERHRDARGLVRLRYVTNVHLATRA